MVSMLHTSFVLFYSKISRIPHISGLREYSKIDFSFCLFRNADADLFPQ